MESLKAPTMKKRDDELALFQEMRKIKKEHIGLRLLENSEELDTHGHGRANPPPLGSKEGSSPIFNISAAAPTRKTGGDDFLNCDGGKNDYDWLLTPPGTPLSPSLEMESQKTVRSQIETTKARPTALKTRLANPSSELAIRNNLASRQTTASLGSNGSAAGIRRPPSSGGSGSRPGTPNGRPTSNMGSKATLTISKSTSITTSKPTASSASKPSRSSTPTSRATLPSSKPTVPPRSSTPTGLPSARSSTPTSRPSIPASNASSRSATPIRRPTAPSSVTNASATSVRSRSSTSVTKQVSVATTRNPVPPRASSPSVKSRPWNPSEMPGFSLDTPPNLRTSLPDRPFSVTRGRPGAPTVRSSSIEPISSSRVRRQSCSPARGRPSNGIIHGCGSSVPAINRAYAKAKDNVSPVVVGNKMVERVINMRKLAPPKKDDKHSPNSNLSGKSSSPDNLGFGRSLSKKSLDMAIRHMDIRRTIPGNLRPLMTNIPALSMYSVRSGPAKGRGVNVSEPPLGTNSNASSEVSFNNNTLSIDVHEIEDDISSGKGILSPNSFRGR